MWATAIFFLCPDVGSTIEAAHLIATDPNLLPPACEWVTGEKNGHVIEVADIIELEDGRLIMIGEVTLVYPFKRGYSAGHLPLIS